MRNANAVILLVEDDAESRELVRYFLQNRGYRTLEASSGDEALDLTRKNLPDLILLDVEMAGISGFEVVKRLKDDSKTRHIPVIMITGLADRESRLRALENGAEDYLIKPVDPAELTTRVRNHLRLKDHGDMIADFNRVLEQQVGERTAQLQDAYREAIYLLTNAAEHRDTDTGKHVRRISYLAAALSRAMNLDAEFVDTIFYASPMHDIGKIGIPDSVLLKPGPLSSSEWAIMRTHTTLGKRILQDGTSPYIRMGATIAETHHECWDGSGYPAGLREEQIPIPGRIMLLCDQYDALRSKRPYKAPLDHEAVTKVIRGGDDRTRPEQFCPSVLAAFESRASEFETIYDSNK